tara:strand:+ start:2519 stop:5074 length:2556 start_codon:yes stop_codon:yes gene_type:complete
MLDKIPEDFDWEFYLSSHPDLVKAGIDTEKLAKYHYISYGKKENRIYKKSQDEVLGYFDKQSNSNDNIVLFVQWYDDPNTFINRTKCLHLNISNPYIDIINIFYETGSEHKLHQSVTENEKVRLVPLDERMNYGLWMQFADVNYADSIKILCNSDIYLDETIKSLKQASFNSNRILAITRKDQDVNGNIVISKERFSDDSIDINPLYSHDCWIYKDKINSIEYNEINLNLGYENCDRLFKKYCQHHNVEFINLFPNINCIHVDHRSEKIRPSYDLNIDSDKKKLVLYTTYYKSSNIQRQHEIDIALTKNINNSYFAKVYIFVDTETELPKSIRRKNYEIIHNSDKPLYFDWISHSQKHLNDTDISLFGNADIVFDDTINILSDYFTEEPTLICLSRYEQKQLCSKPHWSQDTWAFQVKDIRNIKFIDDTKIKTGHARCDNKIAFVFAVNGWIMKNPCFNIITEHLHYSQHRSYKINDDEVIGGMCYIHPSNDYSSSKIDYAIVNKNHNQTHNEDIPIWSLEMLEKINSSNIVKNFKTIGSMYNKNHLMGGWSTVNNLLDNYQESETANINLITFTWETFLSEQYEIFEQPWVGIDHLVNFVPQYYRKISKNILPESNFFSRILHRSKVLENCKGIIYTSDSIRLNSLNCKYTKHIPKCTVHHPVISDPESSQFNLDAYLNNKNKKLINLGWFNRNFGFFERLNIHDFEKLFVFGGLSGYKGYVFREDMYYHGIDMINTEVSPRLSDKELNSLLSKNVIFVNLYDSSANNAIINSVQRNCPIVINRLDACIEYLGSDYPLYYDYPDEIQDLLSESSVASAHEYLKQLDINSFSMDSFVAKINHFVKQVSSHA